MFKLYPFVRFAAAIMISLAFVPMQWALANNDKEEVPAEYSELYAIVEAEKTLMERMESDVPEAKLDKEIQLRLDEIDESYRNYIDKFPNSVFGQILYGKFLRKADRSDDAYAVFLDIHEDNPDIAVVNQHLALFASEIGDFQDALKYWNKAIELEPNQALYHYQFGEYLYTYKIQLMQQHLMSVSEIEDRMVASFGKAHKLAPENRDFHVRWAESFFDSFQPDWNQVLTIWDELLETSHNQFERDVLRLQKVRVLIELQRFYDAEQLLNSVSDPALEEARSKLKDKLP